LYRGGLKLHSNACFGEMPLGIVKAFRTKIESDGLVLEINPGQGSFQYSREIYKKIFFPKGT